MILNKLLKITNILFPENCKQCDSILDYTEFFYCKKCLSKVNLLNNEIMLCKQCSNILDNNDHDDLCSHCGNMQFYFEKNLSIIRYDDFIQKIILDCKNNGKDKQFKYLASYYINKEIELLKDYLSDINLIIPVPTDKKTYKERGFNQALTISQIINQLFGIEINKSIIKINKKNKQQKSLNKEERIKYQNEIYKYKNICNLSNKNILIVDDVFTTGATVNAISKMLNDLNCNKLKIFTLIRVS